MEHLYGGDISDHLWFTIFEAFVIIEDILNCIIGCIKGIQEACFIFEGTEARRVGLNINQHFKKNGRL